jgi:hypothetical protein
MIKSKGIFPQGYRVQTAVITRGPKFEARWVVEYFPPDETAPGTVVLEFSMDREKDARYAARIANAIAAAHRSDEEGDAA